MRANVALPILSVSPRAMVVHVALQLACKHPALVVQDFPMVGLGRTCCFAMLFLLLHHFPPV